jgi:hypothetical protein
MSRKVLSSPGVRYRSAHGLCVKRVTAPKVFRDQSIHDGSSLAPAISRHPGRDGDDLRVGSFGRLGSQADRVSCAGRTGDGPCLPKSGKRDYLRQRRHRQDRGVGTEGASPVFIDDQVAWDRRELRDCRRDPLIRTVIRRHFDRCTGGRDFRKDPQQPSALQSNAILLSVNCGPSNS